MSYVSHSSATSSSGSAKLHSAQAENVHVQSIVQTETQSKVSMENSKKINDLMARLGMCKRDEIPSNLSNTFACLFFHFRLHTSSSR